jgi:hypothetical protein
MNMLTEQFFLYPFDNAPFVPIVGRLCALAPVVIGAEGLDVFNATATPLANWNYMIPLKIGAFATRKTTVPTIPSNKGAPFRLSKRPARPRLKGTAFLGIGTVFIRVGFFVAAVGLVVPLAVFCFPLAGTLVFLFSIPIPPPATSLAGLVGVGKRILAATFALLVEVGVVIDRGTLAMAKQAVSAVSPLARATFLARKAVSFGHQKSSFALVAKGALGYTLFAASADTTVRHSPETLARLPGFFRSFTPVFYHNQGVSQN